MVAASSLRASCGSASTQERISTPSSEMPHSSCQPFAIPYPLQQAPCVQGFAPGMADASGGSTRRVLPVARPPAVRPCRLDDSSSAALFVVAAKEGTLRLHARNEGRDSRRRRAARGHQGNAGRPWAAPAAGHQGGNAAGNDAGGGARRLRRRGADGGRRADGHAAVLGAAREPMVTLRIGYGPNISVVSAFLGFLVIGLIGRLSGLRATRWENNLVQTAGTAAGSGVGFMAVVLAAIDMLNQRGLLNLHLSSWQIFAWLAPSGLLGVLLAVPLRKHYVDEENLPFADGMAAGESLMVLDQGPKEAGPRVAALGIGALVSAGLTVAREQLHWISETISFGFLGPHAAALRLGSEVGVLSLGAGLLVGLRVTLSMGLGMVIGWIILPEPLFRRGLVPELSFNLVLQRWVMWPATGLMVAGGLAALALKWKVIAKTFRGLKAKDVDAGGDFPMRWVIWGSIAAAITLAVVQKVSLGFPLWLSGVSILLSIVLMLVGIRVLGETNWAPISAMANVMQAVFAVLAPGHVPINMIGSGMSGAVAANGEHLMQDYRAGKIVGSTNRNLTWLQLLGVPIGAAAVAITYPAVRAKYGIGGSGGGAPPPPPGGGGVAGVVARGVGPRAAGAPGGG